MPQRGGASLGLVRDSHLGVQPCPIRRHWAFFDLLLWQAKELIIVGLSLRSEDILLLNSLTLLKLKNRNLKRVVVIDLREEIAKRGGMLTELETTWYPNLGPYVSNGSTGMSPNIAPPFVGYIPVVSRTISVTHINTRHLHAAYQRYHPRPYCRCPMSSVMAMPGRLWV